MPGETAFTRTGASSTASVRTSASIAPLTAAVAEPPRIGVAAATPETKTIDSRTSAAWTAANGPQSFDLEGPPRRVEVERPGGAARACDGGEDEVVDRAERAEGLPDSRLVGDVERDALGVDVGPLRARG